MKKLILASASPRRRDILKMLGYEFEIRISDCDETVSACMSPEVIVKTLALRKASAVKRLDGEIVLGSDTIVCLDGKILGKPKNKDDAFEMLSFLSGKTHRVYTGIAVISDEKTVNTFEFSSVTFRNLSQDDINSYIETGECFDKAGGYAIQGIGEKLVEKIEGDFFTVVGLPSGLTDRILSDFGVCKENI